ncbi:hypothetical protein MP228_005440 [Amoeboaphelidium protococcarum]|nr:hypothetical protein MP228_005440 [Amoeboaphelidium protococcarum]
MNSRFTEFYEQDKGEALIARIEAMKNFNALGPPDLVHLVKVAASNGNSSSSLSGASESGSYHVVTGVDCSSSASIAVYLTNAASAAANSQTNVLQKQKQQSKQESYVLQPLSLEDYLSSSDSGDNQPASARPTSTQSKSKAIKHSKQSLKFGTYCVWNAFSRVDVRVEVRIPGGVASYAIDPHGNKRIAMTDLLWEETYVSAALRSMSISYSSPLSPDPITAVLSPYVGDSQYNHLYQQLITVQMSVKNFQFVSKAEARRRSQELEDLLASCANLFKSGYRIGFPDLTQVTSSSYPKDGVHNYLSQTLHQYFVHTGQYELGIKFFSQFEDEYREVSTFIAHYKLRLGDSSGGMRELCNALLSPRQDNGSNVGAEDKVSPQLRYPEVLKAQAIQLQRDGHTEHAIQLLKHCVELSPSDYQLWICLARAFCHTSDYKTALIVLNMIPFANSFQNIGGFGVGGLQHKSVFKKLSPVWNNAVSLFKQLPAPVRKTVSVNEDSPIPSLVNQDVKQFVLVEHPLNNSNQSGSLLYTQQQLQNDFLTYFALSPMYRDACDVSLYSLKGANLEVLNIQNGHIIRSVYSLLCTIMKKIGWEKLLQYRSEAFLMEEEVKKQSGGSQKLSPVDGGSNAEDEVTFPSVDKMSEINLNDDSSNEGKQDEWRGSQTLSVANILKQKRVCEKWFDFLFTVLYEDVRVYEAYKSEREDQSSQQSLDQLPSSPKSDNNINIDQSKDAKNNNYSSKVIDRTPLEMELLGDLLLRLHLYDEALECYSKYLEKRFCYRIHYKQLFIYRKELNNLVELQVDHEDADYLNSIHRLVSAQLISLSNLMFVYERFNCFEEYVAPGGVFMSTLREQQRCIGSEKLIALIQGSTELSQWQKIRLFGLVQNFLTVSSSVESVQSKPQSPASANEVAEHPDVDVAGEHNTAQGSKADGDQSPKEDTNVHAEVDPKEEPEQVDTKSEQQEGVQSESEIKDNGDQQ